MTETDGARRPSRIRIVAWSAAGLVLLTPLVAMQFTTEVNWSLSDFVIFGSMLGFVGLCFELAARKTGGTAFKSAYRLGVGLAVAAAFLLFWVNGAVGIIGSEDNPANLMFMGVLAVGVVGALLARFEAKGMARAMFATGGAQLLTFFVALIAGWGFTGPITLFFCALWFGSAVLFQKAAAQDGGGSD